MSSILNEAIPVLTNMNYGYWGEPSTQDVIALARWITLFSMSYEFIDKPTVCVSSEERSRFRATLDPSVHWHIAIGRAWTKSWDDRAIHRAILIKDDSWVGNKKIHVTIFLFGRLLVMSHYAEYPLGIDFTAIAKDVGLVNIWPNPPARLFQPFRTHNDESVDFILSRFSEIIKAG